MAKTRALVIKTARLNDNEKTALQVFTNRLQSNYAQQVQQISLFGSKARGDSSPDSDIDILVIVRQGDRTLRHEIIDIASEISLEFDVLISPRVISEKRWQTKQGFSLYRNITRDALLISESN
jgi:predicted nucleotidyltransferase